MKRSLSLLFATATVALCVGAVAQAQPGGRGFGMRGGFGMGNNLMSLARIEAVQKEIEAVDDQLAEINKFSEELRAARDGQQRPDFRNMSEEEREKLFAEMNKRREKEAKTANAKIAEILLPHQVKRLKEISLQQRGTSALTDPEVATALKLTDTQKKKLEDVNRKNMETMQSRMRELFQGGNRDGIREKMQALRKEAEQKVLAVLTDKQKKDFEELKGEAFEMPEGSFGRGGGRRGGGGRGERGRSEGGRGRPQRPASDN